MLRKTLMILVIIIAIVGILFAFKLSITGQHDEKSSSVYRIGASLNERESFEGVRTPFFAGQNERALIKANEFLKNCPGSRYAPDVHWLRFRLFEKIYFDARTADDIAQSKQVVLNELNLIADNYADSQYINIAMVEIARYSDPEKAIKVYGELVSKYPDKKYEDEIWFGSLAGLNLRPSAQLALAELYSNAGEYSEAIKVLDSVIKERNVECFILDGEFIRIGESVPAALISRADIKSNQLNDIRGALNDLSDILIHYPKSKGGAPNAYATLYWWVAFNNMLTIYNEIDNGAIIKRSDLVALTNRVSDPDVLQRIKDELAVSEEGVQKGQ